MRRTPPLASGRRRSLRSGVALGTALAVGLGGGLVAAPAFAAPSGSQTGTGTNHATLRPTLTVSPGFDLDAGPAVLNLEGSGYGTQSDFGGTFGGAYVFFGVVRLTDDADPGSWAPSQGGRSGTNYDYATGASQSMVSYPGDPTGAPMTADGDWAATLPIPGPTFTSAAGTEVDCYVEQCGIITLGAHGQTSAGVEVFTPVDFWEAVAPAITTAPVDVTVDEGQDASFSVDATGDPAPTYQWQSRADADGAWADVAGATGSTLTVASVQSSDSGRQYQVIVTNSAGSVPAGPATLTVATVEVPAPSLVVAPTAGLDREGASVTVSGSNFDTSGRPTYPGAPDAPAGVYVSLGWISADEWRPSEDAPAASRAAVVTRWVQETQPTGGQYVAWTRNADGTADFEFTFDGVTAADVLDGRPESGDYRLAVFSIGASGVRQAANEFAYDVSFAPIATTTTVDAQETGPLPTDFAGEDVTVSATVVPVGAAGSVEFFSGETSLGSAAVVDGVATVTTDVLTGGAHQVRAVFTAANEEGAFDTFSGSESAEQTFRIVDPARVIDDIEVGATAKLITGGQLEWTVANYVSLGTGPAKSVLGGDVVLAELPEDADATDRANQAFLFSGGTGVEDAAGNRIVEFDGEVRLTSGSIPEWNFRQPHVHVNAAGEGYVTAIVDGVYRGSILDGEDVAYGPVRVTVATFTGASPATADGETSFTVTPIWEDQTAAGTWAGEFTGSFPNEFVQHLHSGIRGFFIQSGTTGSNLTKPVLPLALAYTAGVAPAITTGPADAAAFEGDDVSFTVDVTGDPAPSLQWQQLVDGEWAAIEGATSATLTLAEVALGDDGSQYRVVAANTFGEVVSDAATLAVAEGEPGFTPEAPELTDENQGGFEVVSINGRTVVVNVGAAHEDGWIGVTLHSDPVFLGWQLAGEQGRVSVTVADSVTGEHRLSYVDADGTLLGWVDVTFAAADGDGDGDTGGTDTDGTDGTGTGGTGTGTGTGAANGLPGTGSEVPVFAAWMGLVLLLGGAAIFALRRRQQVRAE